MVALVLVILGMVVGITDVIITKSANGPIADISEEIVETMTGGAIDMSKINDELADFVDGEEESVTASK